MKKAPKAIVFETKPIVIVKYLEVSHVSARTKRLREAARAPRIVQDAKPVTRRGISVVRPSAAIEVAYRRRLRAMIEAMNKEVVTAIREQWEEKPPATVAMDAAPVKELNKTIQKMVDRWEKKFDDMSFEMADFFTDSVNKQTTARMKRILRKGGIAVKFKTTKSVRDVMASSVAENVQLIKSIPQQYLTDVQGAVMRSAQTGRDLGTLTAELQKKYGITQRRAANIATDQNNKVTSAINKQRSAEAGIDEGIWKHSHGGKKPRPTHVKMNNKKFKISVGMYDPHEKRHIQPGELIHCGCFFKPVIPGFN